MPVGEVEALSGGLVGKFLCEVESPSDCSLGEGVVPAGDTGFGDSAGLAASVVLAASVSSGLDSGAFF